MNLYVDLAKKVVEEYVLRKKVLAVPKDLPRNTLDVRKGVFVTLEKNGQLRGCVGTYLPIKENIAKEIINNAIAAASDPRFSPVKESELPDLRYTVYLLNEPQPVKDIKELDPKKFGIIVKSADEKTKGKLALLLPGLEGINTIEKQVAIACQKGDIDPGREMLAIFKFSVIKYS